MRHGVATSVLANVNRNPEKQPEPYKWDDFVWWKEADVVDEEPELLPDPVEQSNLIRAALFGIAPKKLE